MIAPAYRALARLELADTVRSRWFLFTSSVYGLLFAAFVWLGLRESAVLGFTGLSRVILNLANAVTLAVPLVALVATSQSVVRARQSGLFELLLSQPVRRADWFRAIVTSRFLVVVGPLVALCAFALVASPFVDGADRSLMPVILRCLCTTAALGWAFVGIGLFVSATARSPERATVVALLAWFTTSALHDFALVGLLLKWKLAPYVVFALSAANPAEAARIAILSGVDPDLPALGPVGFWIANSLGPTAAFAVGVGWPVLLGSVALFAAKRRLDASDLVG